MGPHTSSCLSRTVSHISMAIDQHTPLGFLILVVLVQPWLVSPLLVADAACPFVTPHKHNLETSIHGGTAQQLDKNQLRMFQPTLGFLSATGEL